MEMRITHQMGAGEVLNEEEFLRRFIDPGVTHMHAMVVGPTGSGKSHLVRWVYERLRHRSGARIIYIPRSQVNLRQIIEKIIEGETGGEFDQVRRELASAAEGVSKPVLRERMIHYLAEAVGTNGPLRNQSWTDQDEELDRQELMRELPHLLVSPTFRAQLVKEGGIIDQLVDHATGEGAASRIERPMTLETEHLPLRHGEINVGHLDQKAQKLFADLISDGGFRTLALRWLNENTQFALRQLTGMAGRDLEQLMLKVRERLKERDKELILLVEDFARVQGVDGPLLESALVQPRQGETELCRIRSLFAVTTSFLPSKNVEERLTLFVDLNFDDIQEGSKASAPFIATFASKYLNVLRLQLDHPHVLDAWNEQATQSAGELAPIASACEGCRHRTECHGAFGEIEGVGLYPFTQRGLMRMYALAARQDPEIRDSDTFNPRTVVKDVLPAVMRDRKESIRTSTYPDASLRAFFGAQDMPPEDQKIVSRIAQGEQYRAFVELYAAGRLADPPSDAVRETFRLPRLDGVPVIDPEPEAPVVHVETVRQAPMTDALGVKLAILDGWANSKTLPQDLTNELRRIVFDAVDEAFPWNELSRPRAEIKKRLFARESINFPPQETSSDRTIRLEIPANQQDPGERNDAAIALKGLLQFKHGGNWSFADGARAYRLATSLVDRLCESLAAQLEVLKQDSPVHPVPSAVEAATVAARLLGFFSGGNSLTDRYSAIFTPVENGAIRLPGRSEEWRSLAIDPRSGLLELLPELKAIIQNWSGASKGDSTSPQIMDATIVIPALRRALEGPWPQETAAAPMEFEHAKAAQQRIRKGLASAISAEYRLWTARYRVIDQILSPELGSYDHEVVTDKLARTVERVLALGAWRPPSDRFELLLGKFRAADMERLLAHRPVLASATEPAEQFAAVEDQALASELAAVAEFLTFFTKALDASMEWVTDQARAKRAGNQDDANYALLTLESLKSIDSATRTLLEADHEVAN